MGLIARYPLNGNTNDITGNTSPTVSGTLVAAPYGKLNSSYDFTSIGFLTTPTDNLMLHGDLTISFWLYLQALPPAGQRRGIMQTASGAEFAINIEEDGDLQWYYGTSGIQAVPYSSFVRETNFVAGQWYHMALTRNNTTNEMRVFKDGIEVGSAHNPAYDAVKSSASFPLEIGYSYTGYLPGTLDTAG